MSSSNTLRDSIGSSHASHPVNPLRSFQRLEALLAQAKADPWGRKTQFAQYRSPQADPKTYRMMHDLGVRLTTWAQESWPDQ